MALASRGYLHGTLYSLNESSQYFNFSSLRHLTLHMASYRTSHRQFTSSLSWLPTRVAHSLSAYNQAQVSRHWKLKSLRYMHAGLSIITPSFWMPWLQFVPVHDKPEPEYCKCLYLRKYCIIHRGVKVTDWGQSGIVHRHADNILIVRSHWQEYFHSKAHISSFKIHQRSFIELSWKCFRNAWPSSTNLHSNKFSG